MADKLIQIHPSDNVAVALSGIKAGESVPCGSGDVAAVENIPQNFKIALADIAEGAAVVKYGFPIGRAFADIKAGSLVHTHNLKTALTCRAEYDLKPVTERAASCGSGNATFKGYLRPDGRAGIRNEIYIIPTVGCVNEICSKIAERAIRETGKADIHVFKHPYGCSQLGGDQENTQKILSALALHPNAGGVLIVSLGCENNNLNEFKKFLGGYDSRRVKFLVAQDFDDELSEGAEIVKGLAALCKGDRRTDLPFSKLNIGLKCGGSDALSGITANPLTGSASDGLIARGAGVIMTEVPEMFGAEHLLMARSRSAEVKDSILSMVNEFKDYYISHGESVGENPSPGNKEGGISTLEEKSLGCVQKGGTAPVVGVLEYGQQIPGCGLYLLNGPGNDIVAQTALAAAGAHIILFTTGRGTPLGAPVPTVKISTNTALADKKKGWIDFDAGRLLSGESMEKLTDELIALIKDVAEGRQTRNEINGYREIAIWKNGVTL